MQTEIQRQFDRIEQQRAALLREVLALSAAQRDWAPRPDAWSIRQIVHHLVLSDEAFGQGRDGGAAAADALPFRVIPRAWRRAMILAAFRRNVVLPLPSPDVEPRGDVALPELASRWDTARGEMGRVLDTLRGDEPRYAHPVLGPLTAPQMLELAQAHVAYHARQIAGRRRARAFPGGA